MKTLKKILLLLLIGLFSCRNSGTKTSSEKVIISEDTSQIMVKKEKDIESSDTSRPITTNYAFLTDNSLISFFVDDYLIDNNMFYSSTHDLYKKQSGQIFSFGQAWFTNDTLKQTLVFELYSGYNRVETYHFLNEEIPDNLIDRMRLSVSTNNVFDSASFVQKKAFFDGFIKSSTRINQSYFITKKGFKLGDKKQKAIHIYGNPDKISFKNNIEQCEWDFIGDAWNSNRDSIYKLYKKPIAIYSFGHKVIMYFKNDKLIGLILFNDQP